MCISIYTYAYLFYQSYFTLTKKFIFSENYKKYCKLFDGKNTIYISRSRQMNQILSVKLNASSDKCNIFKLGINRIVHN